MISVKQIGDIYMLYMDSVFHFMHKGDDGRESFLLLHNVDIIDNKNIIEVDWWWASLIRKDVKRPGFSGIGIGVDNIDEV